MMRAASSPTGVRQALGLGLGLLVGAGAVAPASAEAPDPPAVSEAHRWDLGLIYEDWETWENDLEALLVRVDRLAELEGGLADGPEHLLAALRAWDEVHRLAMPVENYIRLRLDLDSEDPEALARRPRLAELDRRWAAASSWFEPEVRAIPAQRVDSWLAESPELALYRVRLDRLRRASDRPATPEPASLDRRFGDTLSRLHTALSVAEPPAPTVSLADGRAETLTRSRTGALLATLAEPADRAAVAKGWYQALGERAATFTALLEGIVARQLLTHGVEEPAEIESFAARRWRLPPQAVSGLLAGGRECRAALRRYHRLRARHLGLESYGLADAFVPIVDEAGSYEYEEAVRWILDSTAVLGEEYGALIRRPFAERWVDVHPGERKRATAAAYKVDGEHSFILLNWDGSFRDVLNAAHETGHAMHNLLAHRHQPFVYSRFATVLAETAAITNELLLVDHLGGAEPSRKRRIAQLDLAVQQISRTYLRPVMDAEFELELYRSVARGERLTAERTGALYRSVLADYYGDAIELEPWDDDRWIEIRHFFVAPLYMFQYGISSLAAAGFAERITGGEPSAFLEFLRAGSSRETIDLLELSGVDPTDPESLRAIRHHLESLVSELERLTAE